MQLLTDYPWYFLFFCLLAGGVYAWALYGLGRKKDADLPRWAQVALPALRFAVVTLLAFLLLGPLVRRQVHDKERPIVVVAEDVSESITAHGFALGEEQWEPVLRKLEKDYDVVRYGYAAGLSPEFPESTDNQDNPALHLTNISAALTDLKERYAGRNVAAVVLTGDGLYNQGQNPTGVAPTLAVPLYTVALGDTTQRRDAAIAHVRYNRIAYMGNQFPVEVTVRASLLAGRKSTLTLRQGGRTLAQQPLTYDGAHFTATVTLTVEAEKAGLQSYTLALAPDEAEQTTTNNSRTLVVEVIDGHQKIALLAAAPHPDIAALRGALENNPNYSVDLFLPDKLAGMKPQQWQDYNLLILHNLPNAQLSILNSQFSILPMIFIVGTQTDLGRFNALHSGLEIVARTQKTDEVSASHNAAFSLFTLDADLCRRIEQLPPLQAPFGDYRPAANVQTLFDASLDGVATGRPLMAFGQQEGVRRAFVVGEGLWRWRLHSYQATGSHDDFNTLVEKMVVYTSLQVGKERFRVTTQPVYTAGEAVQLEAELYNDNYEPVNTPEVTLTLKNTDNQESPDNPGVPSSYTFNRNGDRYVLRLGALPAGTYSYSATTTFNGKDYKATGRFAVEEVNLEEVTLVADHALMNTLAATSGGVMLTPDSLDRLPELLAGRDDIRSVIYTHTRYTDLLNVPWVLLLILLLFTLEWGVRKYYFS